jgi:hypothetical protein
MNMHNAEVSISSDKTGKQLMAYELIRECGMVKFHDEEHCTTQPGTLEMDWIS